MYNTELVGSDLIPQIDTATPVTDSSFVPMPIRLATIRPIDVEVNNHLLSRAQLFRHRVAQMGVTWRWIHVTNNLPYAAANTHLRLSSGSEEISVYIVRDAPFILDSNVDPGMFEGSARILAHALRYAPLIDLFEQLTGRSWNLFSAFDCTASADSPVLPAPLQTFAFELAGENTATSMSGWLRFEGSHAAHWLATCGNPPAHRGEYGHLPIRLSAFMRSSDFTAADVASLSVGTVIIAQSQQADQQNVEVFTPNQRHHTNGVFKNGLITLLEPWRASASSFISEKNQTMETPSVQQPNTHDLSSESIAGDLPVEITFCLGHITTTLGQLESNYLPGCVLTLDDRLHGETISIKANGVDIAKGELLQVGELLAVRITRMVKHGSR
jgi:flagellar motor switch/type III secretory pathway protein FliN